MKMDLDMDNFYKNLLLKNIDEYERKNNDVKINDSPLLLKRFMLKTSHVINTCYSNNEFELDERIMKELNKNIINEFECIKRKLGENNLTTIKVKREIDFHLKHNNVTDEFFKELKELINSFEDDDLEVY